MNFFFQRDESLGNKYLFTRPKDDGNDLLNNSSNLVNNSHSLSLENNSNQFNNLNINISDKKTFNNNADKTNQNQNFSNTIPDIKNITKEEMNKFYEEAGNYLPKSNGGMSSEQINLLLHQNKIMQRNVDALQETNRSLQDFIIYTMKKDSLKNDLKEEEKLQEQEKNDNEYNKLNQILSPLYSHINNLQSQVKELNQKKREDEINIELDDLIIKDQKTFKPRNIPFSQPKETFKKDKNEKMMMKTLNSLKGTMSNLSQEMRRIGNTFNEKMQKVLEDTEKTKLKSMIGVRAKSSANNSRKSIKKKVLNKDQSSTMSIFKENLNQNESILTNKLDNIDYNSFKSELIDIGKLQEEIINEYKSSAPEFIELKKPKTKIKFSYNLFSDKNEKENKRNEKRDSRPKPNINIKEQKINKDSKVTEKVSNAVKKEINQKNEKNIMLDKKENEKNKLNPEPKNQVYINNNNKEINNKEYENKMNELNGLSLVNKMNMYKKKMEEKSKKIEEDSKFIGNNNKKHEPNINQINSLNDIGSNHSGITFQKLIRPSFPKENKQKNIIKYNPPKVEYGIFSNKNDFPEDMGNKLVNRNKNNNEINQSENLQKPDNLNNMIKNTIDNYLAAAFSNLKPSEAPKINLDNENNKKPLQKNEIQRVFEKEYIIKNIKEVQNIPQPIVINPPSQSQNINQNNELMDKFTNLAEKFTNLEEKISKQIYEQKNTFEKKIEIIKKKEREIQKVPQPSPQKEVILPNTDLISKLVIDKIKSRMDLEENYNINNKKKEKKKKEKKEIRIKPKEEEKKEVKIDILDINQNIKNEDLDDMIRMPHKINLAEYEVSQTSSYISESLQNNIFNFNNNNNKQININEMKIEENIYNSEIDETKNDNNNINNSRSNGEIESNNGNSSQNDEIINNNINNKNNFNSNANKNGIDLLNIKNANEKLQDNINILENNQNQNNNNKYIDFMNFVNNNQNQYNSKINTNLNPFQDQNDDFFNDSGEA